MPIENEQKKHPFLTDENDETNMILKTDSTFDDGEGTKQAIGMLAMGLIPTLLGSALGGSKGAMIGAQSGAQGISSGAKALAEMQEQEQKRKELIAQKESEKQQRMDIANIANSTRKEMAEDTRKFKEDENEKDRLLRKEISKDAKDTKEAITSAAQAIPKAQQKLIAGYATRMEQAEEDMQNVFKSGYDPTSILSSANRKQPFEALKSTESKNQRQAERNFLNAVLRRESGAAISPSEHEEGSLQYFPRVGDDKETLAQKERNRLQVIENFKAEAGPEALANIKKINIPKKEESQSQDDGTATAATGKTIVKKLVNQKTGQTKYIYSDGSEEIK